MDKKLVKEIVTTETEKFTDDGTIKERIKEIREKVYSDANAFSKKEIEEAKEAETEEEDRTKEEESEAKEPTKEELIAEASNKINSTQTEQSQQTAQNPYMPTSTYNVLNRTTPQPMGPINQMKFPWEK